LADAYLKELQAINGGGGEQDVNPAPVLESVQTMDTTPDASNTQDRITQRTGDISSQMDAPDVPTRFREKKRLDWAGKTCTYTDFILVPVAYP
jgi:hypothetical protein